MLQPAGSGGSLEKQRQSIRLSSDSSYIEGWGVLEVLPVTLLPSLGGLEDSLEVVTC